MIKAVLAADDESDEGAGLLIDMTKVTSSTLADNPLPHLMNGWIIGSIREDLGAA